jgi:hypothetical protein
MLNLTGGPTLEVLGLGSPFLNHAWNVGNLGESYENGTHSEHVGQPESDSSKSKLVRQIRNASNMDDNAKSSIG